MRVLNTSDARFIECRQPVGGTVFWDKDAVERFKEFACRKCWSTTWVETSRIELNCPGCKERVATTERKLSVEAEPTFILEPVLKLISLTLELVVEN